MTKRSNSGGIPDFNLQYPMLYELSSLFGEQKLMKSRDPNNLVIALLAAKIRTLAGGDLGKNYLDYLSAELGIEGGDFLLSKVNDVPDYQISQLEELISVIFQTKYTEAHGLANGMLLRKQRGVFHTPYPIAALIAKEAGGFFAKRLFLKIKNCSNDVKRKVLYDGFTDLKIIDPACGTGIILSAMIDFLISINDQLAHFLSGTSYFMPKDEYVQHVIMNSIFGVDIDKQACSVARAIVESKYPNLSTNLNSNIKCGDSIVPGGLFSRDEFSFDKEFPSAFLSRNGFDILVMNPPYERLKVDKSEFKEEQGEDKTYEDHKRNTTSLVSMIRKSRCYPLSDDGVLDLYKLFIDRSTQITNEKGAISFIVPMSLLGDWSCRKIRAYILNNTWIGNIYCIPESAKVFEGVSQAFCVMGFKKGKSRRGFTLYKDTISADPLRYTQKINVRRSDITLICPESSSIPMCDEKGWRILKKIHRFPPLEKIDAIVNLRGELDLTLGSEYITSDETEESLVRGNAIDAYRLKEGRNHKASHAMLGRLRKDKFGGMKLQYVNSIRLVGQQIVNMGVNKRLKFAIIDKGVVANSCNFISLKESDKTKLFYLLGLLNSALLNWRFKLTSTNNHVNNYELDELPIVMEGKAYFILSKEIIKIVTSQIEEYSDEKQMRLDALISIIYGLGLNEVTYIADALDVSAANKTILVMEYKHAKNNI